MVHTNGLTKKTAPKGYTMRVYDSSKAGTRRRAVQRRRIHVLKDGQDVVLSGRQLRLARKRARVIAKQQAQRAVQHQDSTTT